MGLIGTVTGGTGGLGTGVQAGSGSSFETEPDPVAPAPVAPAPVVPFPTADDMLRVTEWLTNWQTQMEDIDYGISQQEIDTTYQKAANDRQAVEDRSAADEAMAARGIFRSSLRDAATYDIEATRALANTYLDSKLNEAVTAGATRKGTLAAAKGSFETGMQAKYGENAAVVNDKLNEGYATALANYKPPKATSPSATGPTAAKRAPLTAPQVRAQSQQATATTRATQASRAAENRSRVSANSTPVRKPKTPKVPKPKKPRR